jgi:curved DNA-binding protein CbpA
MSLYDHLGVRADATPEEIKRAGRAAQKRTHPDAGGDPAEFQKVQNALVVLLDPAKRQHYDRTGEEQTIGPEAHEIAEAHALVGTLTAQAMGDDPRYTNLPEKIAEAIRRTRQQMMVSKEQTERNRDKAAEKLEGFLKRLKRKAPGEDVVRATLEGELRRITMDAAAGIARFETHIRVCDRALAMVEGYEYELEARPQPGYPPTLSWMR